jgi:hypothetical protein
MWVKEEYEAMRSALAMLVAVNRGDPDSFSTLMEQYSRNLLPLVRAHARITEALIAKLAELRGSTYEELLVRISQELARRPPARH